MFREGMSVTRKEVNRFNIGIHPGGGLSVRVEDTGQAIAIRVPNARGPNFQLPAVWLCELGICRGCWPDLGRPRGLIINARRNVESALVRLHLIRN